MIGSMPSNRVTYDLTARDGVIAYLQCAVMPDIQRAFSLRGSLAPFGVVFARQGSSKMPTPLLVGQPGMGAATIKQAVQKLALRVQAVGCAYVRQDRFDLRAGGEATLVVVQVEHKAFEDLAWCAPVVQGKLLPFAGPEAVMQASAVLKRTALMPERCMS